MAWVDPTMTWEMVCGLAHIIRRVDEKQCCFIVWNENTQRVRNTEHGLSEKWSSQHSDTQYHGYNYGEE